MQGEQGNSYQRINQKLAYNLARNANTGKKNTNYVTGTLKVNGSPGSKTHKETQKHKKTPTNYSYYFTSSGSNVLVGETRGWTLCCADGVRISSSNAYLVIGFMRPLAVAGAHDGGISLTISRQYIHIFQSKQKIW